MSKNINIQPIQNSLPWGIVGTMERDLLQVGWSRFKVSKDGMLGRLDGHNINDNGAKPEAADPKVSVATLSTLVIDISMAFPCLNLVRTSWNGLHTHARRLSLFEGHHDAIGLGMSSQHPLT